MFQICNLELRKVIWDYFGITVRLIEDDNFEFSLFQTVHVKGKYLLFRLKAMFH